MYANWPAVLVHLAADTPFMPNTVQYQQQHSPAADAAFSAALSLTTSSTGSQAEPDTDPLLLLLPSCKLCSNFWASVSAPLVCSSSNTPTPTKQSKAWAECCSHYAAACTCLLWRVGCSPFVRAPLSCRNSRTCQQSTLGSASAFNMRILPKLHLPCLR
jgi:hypothetical protein